MVISVNSIGLLGEVDPHRFGGSPTALWLNLLEHSLSFARTSRAFHFFLDFSKQEVIGKDFMAFNIMKIDTFLSWLRFLRLIFIHFSIFILTRFVISSVVHQRFALGRLFLFLLFLLFSEINNHGIISILSNLGCIC